MANRDYDAFISYSHAADGLLAPRLQQALQRFAKPWYRRRALRVFRDETGLSANPSLWTSIAEGLERSTWFLLLASPQAAQSEWVEREVAWWCEHRELDHLLILQTGGELEWDSTRDQFDTETTTSLPAALLDAFPDEPRHVDMRWAEAEEQLDLRDGRFRDLVAEIAAPMHGLAKDDLAGEEVRQHRRTIRTAWSAGALLTCLLVAAVILSILATTNARQAHRARDQATKARDDAAFQLVEAQAHELRLTNRDLALLLAVEARHERDTPSSQGIIQSALVADRGYLGTTVDRSTTTGFRQVCPLGEKDLALTVGTDGTVGFVDLRSGRALGARTSPPGRGAGSTTSTALGCEATGGAGAVYVVSEAGGLWSVDPLRRRLVGPIRRLPRGPNQIAVSPDGDDLMVGMEDGRVLVGPLDPTGGELVTLSAGEGAAGVAFSPDGRTAMSTARDSLIRWDPATWTELGTVDDQPDDAGGGLVAIPEDGRSLHFSPDGLVVGDSRTQNLQVFDAQTWQPLWHAANSFALPVPFTFSPDSRRMYVFAEGIETHATRTGSLIGERINVQVTVNAASIAVSRDGRSLYVPLSARPGYQNWALDDRSAVSNTIAVADSAPGVFSADGHLLVVVPAGGSYVTPVKVFDVRTRQLVADLPVIGLPTIIGTSQLAGYFVDRAQVDRFDVRTQQRVGPRFAFDLTGLASVAVAQSGHLVVSRTDGAVDIYDPTGRKLGEPWLKLDAVSLFVAVSPDGGSVAIATDPGVRLYSTKTARPISRVLKVGSPEFSRDGRYLAGISYGGRFRLFDAHTGEPIGRPVSVGQRWVWAQMPTGPNIALVSASAGQIYDRSTRVAVGEVFPSSARPRLAPGGRMLATSTGRSIVLWDLDPDHWERAACKLAGRNLTRREWHTYFPNRSTYRRTCSQWPAGDR